MVAPLIPIAAGIAARLAAKKVAQEAAKKTAKAAAAKTAQIAKNSVRVKYNKQAMENAIKDSQLKTKRPNMSPSRPVVSPPGSGRAVKINSNPVKSKQAPKKK